MNDNILPKETVMLDKFASDLNLEMLYAGRGIITLTSISVDSPHNAKRKLRDSLNAAKFRA